MGSHAGAKRAEGAATRDARVEHRERRSADHDDVDGARSRPQPLTAPAPEEEDAVRDLHPARIPCRSPMLTAAGGVGHPVRYLFPLSIVSTAEDSWKEAGRCPDES